MKKIIGAILIIFSLVVFGGRIYQKITFKKNVSGYLKRAADANTIGMAEKELTKVLNYLEANEMTRGYTSILYKTPNEDIGFWYQNLKASRDELQKLGGSSQLEKTNVLIKLRETLLDTGEKTRVTVPKGMSTYPNNAAWAAATWAALFALIFGIVMVIPKEAWEQAQAEQSAKKG